MGMPQHGSWPRPCWSKDAVVTSVRLPASYGVSRRWAITLVQRYLIEGDDAACNRAHEDRIAALIAPRKTSKTRWSRSVRSSSAMGMRPARRRSRLHLSAPPRCQPGGVHDRRISQHEACHPQPHKRPKSSYIRFQAEQPNERWQSDITHWQLADRTDVEILNIIDDHSRLCLGSDTLPGVQSPDVNNSFSKAVAAYGNPASLLSDNGAVFTGRYRGTGRVALEVTLHSCGIRFQHGRPYHPQTCGKVERLHQTLKKWLTPEPGPHPRPPANPARRLPRLLQHRAPAPRT